MRDERAGVLERKGREKEREGRIQIEEIVHIESYFPVTISPHHETMKMDWLRPVNAILFVTCGRCTLRRISICRVKVIS